MLVGLPGALLDMAFGAWGCVRGHQASRLRHFADVGQFFTLSCVLLPLVVSQLLPAVASVAACSAAGEACHRHARHLRDLHAIMLALNVAMLCWDAAKFVGNGGPQAQPRTEPRRKRDRGKSPAPAGK